MSVLLETDDLKKTYKVGKIDVEALRGVSIRVNAGEFVAIMGPSGCGKSTLLRTITGLTEVTSGDVLYRGTRIAGVNPKTALVFQSFAQFRVTFLDLLEQAYVFNCDDGLASESFHQFDLPVSKRLNKVAPNRKDSYRGIFPQERHRQGCSSPGLSRHRVTFDLGIQIMDRPSL